MTYKYSYGLNSYCTKPLTPTATEVGNGTEGYEQVQSAAGCCRQSPRHGSQKKREPVVVDEDGSGVESAGQRGQQSREGGRVGQDVSSVLKWNEKRLLSGNADEERALHWSRTVLRIMGNLEVQAMTNDSRPRLYPKISILSYLEKKE